MVAASTPRRSYYKNRKLGGSSCTPPDFISFTEILCKRYFHADNFSENVNTFVIAGVATTPASNRNQKNMRVYKFGGASVSTANGVKNLFDIVQTELVRRFDENNGDSCCSCGEDGCAEEGHGKSDGLLIIVSAMGKTTNALEQALERFVAGDKMGALEILTESERYHKGITDGLFGEEVAVPNVDALFSELKATIANSIPHAEEYDRWYDQIVGYGELISTTIISEYLRSRNLNNMLLDMRKCFITDNRHRDANIDIEASTPILREKVEASATRLFVGQGFIGGTVDGEPTTLGREGSDYSAAVAAYILDAHSVTIWKDVIGILNADPKIFADATHIPEMTYLDAIELAYSGAQIIHPKTIKPLQNKNIPLYVRPFGDKSKPGSVVKGEMDAAIDVPILIVKHNQVLLSIRPDDFSFVLEDRLGGIFSLLERYNAKINMVQSSAVSLSLSVDASRRLPEAVEELRGHGFRVAYNDEMELLTIRGYTEELYKRYGSGKEVYLTQKTRRTVRIVRRKQ